MQDFRRVRHSGNDPLRSFDRIVFVCFYLRKPIERGLRQFALLDVVG
jgi:hypothetical protein